MSGPPVISVVTPFYNRSAWLASYLGTLEQQTFKHFEVVIVDDGSTDGLADAVASRQTSFPLRLITLEQNRGAGAARNVGIDNARGRYVALLDSDDAWRPGKLARDLARFEAARDPDRLVGVSRHVVVGRRSYVQPRRLIRAGDTVGRYLFQLQGVLQSSTMFLASDLGRAARFAEGEPGHDDWAFALRLEAAGARFEMDPEALTYYRDDERPDRRSPRRVHTSLAWLERYRELLGEDAYLAGRAIYASRMRGTGRLSALSMIATACLRGAVSPWRSAYYLSTWGLPAIRTLVVSAAQMGQGGRALGAAGGSRQE